MDPEWVCLLRVFGRILVVDFWFYSRRVSLYKDVLNKTRFITRFEEASKAIAHIFKKMVPKSSVTRTTVLTLLASYYLQLLSASSPHAHEQSWTFRLTSYRSCDLVGWEGFKTQTSHGAKKVKKCNIARADCSCNNLRKTWGVED